VGHLRCPGRRRAQLITAATASVQRIGDFLPVAWPVVTEACAGPFESVTWLAAVQVVTSRCGGDPARLAVLGLEEFTAVVRAAVPAWGGTKGWGKIIGRVFAATGDTEGVVAWSRRGLLRRVADELGDLARTRAQLRAVEADMVMVLGELGLSRLGGIPGLSAVGAAAILAETGDPRRYDGSSSLVKHAGLSPVRERLRRFRRPGAHIPPRPARPEADRLACGMADAAVQPGDGRQVRRDDPGRRRRGGGRAAAGQGGGSHRPRAARQGPGGVRGLLAPLDLLPGRPRHQLGRRGRLRRRRLPARGGLTSPSIRPHRRGCPLTFLPGQGRASPHCRRGPAPIPTPGSSPRPPGASHQLG
jgi:hypothetical protein